MPRFEGPELLRDSDRINGFQCGTGSLDVWLVRHARGAAGSGSARTYVVTDQEQSGRVVGYHALTVASVEPDDATERARQGMGTHDIPAILLARLAVDETVQRRGIGAWLLADAMRRAISVAEAAGIRIILVHAVDERARDFYLNFGFEVSPTNDMHVQLLLKDARKSLNESADNVN